MQSRDNKVLTKLPGIGKKTAERLLLELKDKVGPVAAESADSFGEAVAAGGSGAVAEAIEALASLGYSNSEIMPIIHPGMCALEAAPSPDSSTYSMRLSILFSCNGSTLSRPSATGSDTGCR